MWRSSRAEFISEELVMSKRLVIVGGGAAGPSTAAEAKRRNPSLEVTMIEKGDFVSYAA
jgi:CoA-dependent NAD(P)H sulfur oxidoreductase